MNDAATQDLKVDIRIDGAGWLQEAPKLERDAVEALSAASRRMRRSGDVSILFTDDAEMRRLNAHWRGKDAPTDVLSFPGDAHLEAGGQAFLGDVALGLETVRRDAQTLGRPVELHIRHLLVHGFLHLLGYDHEEESEALTMEALEKEILAGLGLPDPYGDAV